MENLPQDGIAAGDGESEQDIKSVISDNKEKESEDIISNATDIFTIDDLEDILIIEQSKFSFTYFLGKVSSIIIFSFRLILATFANLGIILSVLVLYSLYLLILGSVFYGIYFTVTGKSDRIKYLNEAIQDVAEITIAGIGRLFSGLGKFFETISTSPFWQIVFISLILIISLNHVVRVGFGGLNTVASKKLDLMKKITKWSIEPLKDTSATEELDPNQNTVESNSPIDSKMENVEINTEVTENIHDEITLEQGSDEQGGNRIV